MLKVNIKNIKELQKYQQDKLIKCVDLLERILNSPEFKEAVLNFSYKESYYTGRLWWKKWYTDTHKGFRFEDDDGRLTRSMSNLEVYQTIMSGAETLNPVSDNEADIEIRVTTDIATGVIGYTYPDVVAQWIAKWYFDEESVPSLCNNISHEWIHKMGFDHAFDNHSLRRYTVPYAIGDIVGKLARKYFP